MYIPSTFTTIQFQQNFIGDFKIGGLRNRLLVGLDYTYLKTSDTRTTLSFYDGAYSIPINIHTPMYKDVYENMLAQIPTKNRVVYERDTRTYSVYVSDVINITNRLNVMASLRFDRFDNNDPKNGYMQTAWAPKAGVVYQFIEDKASAFVNYMDGFRNIAPYAGNEAGDIKIFKPEHASQWEGGFKLELFNRKLNSTISFYHIKVKDRTRSVQSTSPSAAVPSYTAQDGTQVSKGFEMDIIANPIVGMHIILGYGYNSNEYTKGDENIVGKTPYGSPRHAANFWISHKLTEGAAKGWGIGLGGTMASSHFFNDANTITVPGYGKLDASLFYEQSKVRIGLKVNNIGNKKYWTSDFWAEMQATRQFIANVTYRF